ncbi:hypothetical protein R83H12_01815 [Fibrobacteria bacterium R8-3-H12]
MKTQKKGFAPLREGCFLLFACLVPFAVFILPILGYKDLVYKLDSYSPFWIFSLQLGLGLLLFVKLSKDFYLWLKELIPSPLSLVPISIIVIFALAMSIAFIEPRSRVQSDESIHYVIAQNLYHNQIGQICVEGLFTENGGMACVMGTTIKTRGLSYIYMLGMPFFGTDLYWVHNLHLFFLVVALVAFYLALPRQQQPAVATALLASCPILLFCFRSASVEPIYVTMFCISLLFLKWAYDRNTTRHWLLLALTLAFFAQTRTETVFCLFAFIAVVAYKLWKNPLATSHSPLATFSTFLATLSFFSLPVLCTLSYNRDSDLQGGAYGAHGHLLGNIITDFKIMALPHANDDGTLVYPFLPYFTWLALLGLITLTTLTILTIKELKKTTSHSPLATPQYKHITAFLILLSPQYLILFDGVSADFTMTIQHRFALVILPPMAFLGSLFLCQTGTILKKIKLFNPVNPFILKIGVQTIILTTCLVQYKTFIKDITIIGNFVPKEDYEFNKWVRQEPQPKKLFFYWHTLIPLAHGYSSYLYQTFLNLNSEDLSEILKEYDGEVYFVGTSTCDVIVGKPKMRARNTFRECDRAMRYFNSQEVFRKKIMVNTFKDFTIHRILGFNDIDSLGLLRILNKIEPTDTTVNLMFKIPKELSKPWKIRHFVNDSLLLESSYKKDYYTDTYNLSLFNKDTNIWKLSIIDTITGEQVHSDFWELVRVKKND